MGLFGKKKKTEDIGADVHVQAVVPDRPPETASDAVSGELLAVLAAAVAAYEAEAYTPKLDIRKINRAAGTRLAWAAAGTNEAIDVRRI
jgi:hypothetical protein